jgi:hypothetical protein
MEQDKTADTALLFSGITAYISIGAVQQYVSIAAGLVAIIAGVFSIRYYIIKSKKNN